jgi:hypothetical protein
LDTQNTNILITDYANTYLKIIVVFVVVVGGGGGGGGGEDDDYDDVD